jgi:predicted flap endonuclease-1-like 5' DNA nuclease
MPYTLGKIWFWWLLAAAIGFAIGYLFRNLKGDRSLFESNTKLLATENKLAEAQAALKSSRAELEACTAERTSLKSSLKSAEVASGAAAETEATEAADNAQADAEPDQAETVAEETAAEETAVEETAAEETAAEETAAAAPAAVQGFAAVSDSDSADSEPLDLTGAEAAIGKKIKLDDLKVVEGIGPKIAELCENIGITTWAGLADTPVSTLQSMLDEAGPAFTMQNPGTWPEQAGLLATGKWAAFKELTDRLDGGK